MNRRGTATLAAITMAATIVAAIGPPVHAVAGRRRVTRNVSRVAPGLRLVTIVDTAGPEQIYELRFNPRRRTTLDVAHASTKLVGRAPTSDIAEDHGAVAAINGDFMRDPGRPLHLFMEDGALLQSGLRVGKVFASAAGDSGAWVGRPPVNVSAHVTRLAATWPVADWNSGTAPGSIVAFTAAASSAETPPHDSCWAQLAPVGALSWGSRPAGRVARAYEVSDLGCAYAAPTAGPGVLLSAPRGSVGGDQLASLTSGDEVRLTWALGWPGVTDAIAAEPQLLDAGAVVAPSGCGYICSRNPRTAIGVTATGMVVMVVVDGRSSSSVGMTLVELARFLQDEGLVSALNLDGGGSSTMVVRGRVVNHPPDGSQRPVANAVVILPGADPGEHLT